MAAPSLTYTLTNGTTADASQAMQNFNDLLNGITDGTKDLSISALTCAGTATLNGHVNLGNSSADDLTITASLAADLVPKTDGARNLGSASLGFAGVYFGDGSGDTARIVPATLAADRTYTLPDAGAAADFVMTAGTQTLTGAKTFSAAPDILTSGNGTYLTAGGTSARRLLFTDSTTTNVGDTHTLNANSSTGAIKLAINSNAFVYLDSNGNLLVGPSNGSNGALRVQSNAGAASSADPVLALQYSSDTNCTGGYFVDCRNSAGATIGRIEAASNTTTAFTTSSDERLKESFSSFDGLSLLSQIQAKEYSWKSNPGLRARGFVAQELYQVLPEAVSVGNDLITDSGDLKNPWGVDYAKLTPILVKALQELKAQFDAYVLAHP